MTKISALSTLAVAAILSVGTAMAQPATHRIDYRAATVSAHHIVQVDLKATDDEAGPSWTTPNYTPAQIAAASHNGESDLNAVDQEGNVVPAPGLASPQLAVVPADNGPTDLNAYDNAA
jgi:hypothetical protein